MRKIITLILLGAACCMLLTGCVSASLKVLDKKTPEQVEQTVIDYIKDISGDTVTVELVDKNRQEEATAWFDGPMMYRDVKGGDRYEFTVTPQQYPDLHVPVTYCDGYLMSKRGSTTRHEARIMTDYVNIVARYALFFEFKEIVRKFDPEGYAFQVGQSDNFIAAVCLEDFDEITTFYLELNDFQHRSRKKSYLEMAIFYLDSHDIDFSKIEDDGLVGNTLDYEYNIVKGLELGEPDRFAYAGGDDIWDVRDFYEKRANMEESWRIPGEGDDADQYYYMRHSYEQYGRIIFMECMEPNKHDVSWFAWGID